MLGGCRSILRGEVADLEGFQETILTLSHLCVCKGEDIRFEGCDVPELAGVRRDLSWHCTAQWAVGVRQAPTHLLLQEGSREQNSGHVCWCHCHLGVQLDIPGCEK